MASVDQTLARLRMLTQAMNPKTASVDEALPALRALLIAAKVPFRLVGGIAVVHHGYARMTEDIDVLLDSQSNDTLDPLLAAHDFVRSSRTRLLHAPTGVRVDLLIAGDPAPRDGDPPYPTPDQVGSSTEDAAVASLAGLVMLKLRARRHQDLADVVALLKKLDEARYVELESSTPSELHRRLADLRRDALEEIGAG